MRSAARYMRSRQLQKSSSLPSLRSVSPAIARWKAWLCALTRPGSTGPSSFVADCRSAALASGSILVQRPPASASSSTSRAQAPRTHASGAKNRRSTRIQRLAGDERRKLHFAHDRLDRSGELLVVVERQAFSHVKVLAHLELHRVHVLRGPPVVARDVAALEATVDRVRHLRISARRVGHGLRDLLVGARIARGADVEARQLALEKTGDARADAV